MTNNPKSYSHKSFHIMEVISTRIGAYCEQQFENMREHGFGQNPEIGTLLMLIVSELSEALEADRKGKHLWTTDKINNEPFRECSYPEIARNPEMREEWKHWFEENVKDSFEDEIADAFLRLFDLVGRLGIDIDTHIEIKSFYNSLRETKNGKNY